MEKGTGSSRIGEAPPVHSDTLTNGKETDIVIPILGPTGAGKSTFINIALGKDKLKIGHSVNSSTSQVSPIVIYPIPGFPDLQNNRLVLVDTPGFDDTYVDDVRILKRIAKWLAESYRKNMPIGGVLYLHDISLKRFTGTARRNLEMFQHLCGAAALHKVILSATCGESIDPEVLGRRETELSTVYWKYLIEQQAQVRRFLGNSKSAWDIINTFLARARDEKKLLIQEEVVVQRMRIPETEAGRVLLCTLQEAFEAHKQLVELEAAVAEGRGQEAKAKLKDTREKMARLRSQIQALQLSLPQRVLKWFGL